MASTEPFSYPILASISTAREQNGLRHHDYPQYRRYCSRRLQRTRKATGRPNKNFAQPRRRKGRKGKQPQTQEAKTEVKATQEEEGQAGQGQAVESKKQKATKIHLDETTVTNSKALSLPLFNAERAWSHAMELKSDVVDENPKKRHHLLQRLRKAKQWSSELERVCNLIADPQTQLEAEAYGNMIRGFFFAEQEAFKPSLTCFQHSKAIFELLSSVADPETQMLCKTNISAISPFLKHSQLSLKRQKGQTLDAKVVDAFVAARQELAQEVKETVAKQLIAKQEADKLAQEEEAKQKQEADQAAALKAEQARAKAEAAEKKQAERAAQIAARAKGRKPKKGGEPFLVDLAWLAVDYPDLSEKINAVAPKGGFFSGWFGRS